MKRSVIWIVAMGLGFGSVAGRAAAEASPIATSMGDLRWGLSEHEVSSYAKRELAAQFNDAIAHTKDSGKQAKLKSELKSALGDIDKSLTKFEGKHSRWDGSPVAGEFTYDNNESMMVAKGTASDNYYFFVSGKLWKIVKVLDKKAAGGGDFKKFSQSVEGKFGKGRAKKGELTPGQGNTQWLEYLDRNSRMRAADSSGKRSGFAMIYEEMAMVRELASTRPTKPSRLGGLSDEDEAAPKNQLKADSNSNKASNNSSANDEQIAKASTKRSVFGNERHEESDGEFQTRKQKLAAEARDRQLRAHERKEDAKKGEALKQLDGLNDSDPLGGL